MESQVDPSIQIVSTYVYVQLGLKKSTNLISRVGRERTLGRRLKVHYIFCLVLCALAKHHCYIFGAVWDDALGFLTLGKEKKKKRKLC